MPTVNEKMVAIANEVRELSGTTDPLGLDKITVCIEEANNEIDLQNESISEILLLLEGKNIESASLQSKRVMPTAIEQIIYPDNGYEGLSSVIVDGDSNLRAQNIVEGINIFGVEGTYSNVDGANSIKAFVPELPAVTAEKIYKKIAPSIAPFESVCAYTNTDYNITLEIPATAGDNCIAVFALRDVVEDPITPEGWIFYSKFEPHASQAANGSPQTLFVYKKVAESDGLIQVGINQETNTNRLYGVLLNIRDSDIRDNSVNYIDDTSYKVESVYENALFFITNTSAATNTNIYSLTSEDFAFTSHFKYGDGSCINSRLSYYYREWNSEHQDNIITFNPGSTGILYTVAQIEIIPGTPSKWSYNLETANNSTNQSNFEWIKNETISDGLSNISYINGVWLASCYANSVYNIYYSYDGVLWESSNSLQLSGACVFPETGYGKGIWVAGVNNNGLIYSEDGIIWNQSNITTSGSYYEIKIVYANGLWVADTGKQLIYSNDGKIWSNTNIPANYYSNVLAYNDGVWIYCRRNDGIYYSKNGQVWNPSNLINGYGSTTLAYGGGLWIANAGESVYCSSNGEIWERVDFPGNYTYKIEYHKGIWVSVDNDNGSIIYSLDGKQWHYSNILNTGETTYFIYYLDGVWFIAFYGKQIYCSMDGKVWRDTGIPPSYYPTYALKYHGYWVIGMFDNYKTYYSNDCAIWKTLIGTITDISSMKCANGIFLGQSRTNGLCYSKAWNF